MPEPFSTYATLEPGDELNAFFPGGQVPTVSVVPIIPRERGAPPCYLVPGRLLTPEQIEALAERLHALWKREGTLEEITSYVRDGETPLKTSRFVGATTHDPAFIRSLIDEYGLHPDQFEDDLIDTLEDGDEYE